MHYNLHRYYDPSTGRYISADPVGQHALLAQELVSLVGVSIDDLQAGSPGPRFEAATPNLYSYVVNDPLNLIDPYGLQAIPGDDSITARAKSIAARGNRDELERFLRQFGDDISPNKKKKLLEQCENVFKRKAKDAEKAFRTNKDFRDFVHRDFKPDVKTPGGGSSNPDLSPRDLVDAAEEFFGSKF